MHTGQRLAASRMLVVILPLVVPVGVVNGQDAGRPPAVALDTTAVPRKNATTATLLSVLLAGAGHLYAEDRRRGLVLLSMTAAGLALHATGENAVTLPAFVLVAGPWWYGVIDAHNAVGRYNRRRASRVSLVPRVTPERGSRQFAAFDIGMTVRLTW